MSHEKSGSCLQEKKDSGSFKSVHDGTSLENTLIQNLQLSSQTVLEIAQKKGRSKCPKCNSSRMFYCYTCFVPVESVPSDDIPVVKLPLKIDIIKHPNETDGKSTAVHAKLLAHEDVTIYTYPCVPQYHDQKHEVVVVFPGPDSVSLSDYLLYLSSSGDLEKKSSSYEPSSKRSKCSQENAKNTNEVIDKRKPVNFLKKVVFIDSTWNQTNKIISDERLQGLVYVELMERKTFFWRHQKGTPNTYLSTIEAIYYFMVDYHTKILQKDYKGEYDNLLFFFSFMYRIINDAKKSAGKL